MHRVTHHTVDGTVHGVQWNLVNTDLRGVIIKLSQGLGIQGNLSNRTLDGTCEYN